MDKLEYVLLRLLYGIFQLFPVSIVKALAHGITFIVRVILKYRYTVILENIMQAFPGLSESEQKRLMRASYRHFIYLWIELLITWRLDDSYFTENFESDDMAQITGIVGEGKPVILVGGHLGNFEWLGYFLSRHIPGLYAFMKRIHNPYINEFMISNRRRMGLSLITVDRSAFKKGLAMLKSGKSLALLADQDVGERGIFVTFLNRPAATATGTAIYHRQTGIPVFHCAAIRKSFGKFSIYVERIPDQSPGNDKAMDIFSLTQKHTALLEQLVKRHPEQYFWSHRRWKSRPENEELELYKQYSDRYRKMMV